MTQIKQKIQDYIAVAGKKRGLGFENSW